MTIVTPRSRRVAEFAVNTDRRAIPEQVHSAARRSIIDSLGAMLSGRTSPAGTVIIRYAAPWLTTQGRYWTATLQGRSTTAEGAALVNATLGHALDFDDSMPGVGHGGVPVLAALLAVAPECDVPVDGASFEAAFVVGIEVMAATARALGVGHTYRGWHMTCTAGTLGATAAASRLLGLHADQTVTALGVASSLVGGLQRNFGTTVKPLHSGLAAQHGVAAARLARTGATAAREVFDGQGGLLALYGTESSDPSRLDRLGNSFALAYPGMALKQYPCCYVAARPIDVLLQLRSEYAFAAHDIEAVSCRIPVGGMHPMRYPTPTDGLQAKFSMPYLLAAAAVDGEVTLASFSDAAVKRPDVRALMDRVTAVEDEALRPEDPQGTSSSPATGGRVVVSVRLADGREITAEESEPYGGPEKPLSWSDLESKVEQCAMHGGFDTDTVGHAVGQFSKIDAVPDVLTLVDGIRAATAR